jgi:hypothetical protein
LSAGEETAVFLAPIINGRFPLVPMGAEATAEKFK